MWSRSVSLKSPREISSVWVVLVFEIVDISKEAISVQTDGNLPQPPANSVVTRGILLAVNTLFFINCIPLAVSEPIRSLADGTNIYRSLSCPVPLHVNTYSHCGHIKVGIYLDFH